MSKYDKLESMKVEVLQEKIANGIGLTNRIASSRTTLPVLANTLLETDQGRLKLSGTNLEVSLEFWVGGKVEEEGRITVPTGLLFNYLQNLTPEKLIVSLQDNQLVVGGSTTEARFVTTSAEEFPTFPQVSQETILTLAPAKLQNILKRILFAAATNESRPVLTGILCRGTSDGLIMVATDGFRLAEMTVSWSAIDAQPPTEPVEMIIPAKMLKELGQFSTVSTGDEPWHLRLTEDKNCDCLLGY
jgi:DNA polymerase-3 subunit beta